MCWIVEVACSNTPPNDDNVSTCVSQTLGLKARCLDDLTLPPLFNTQVFPADRSEINQTFPAYSHTRLILDYSKIRQHFCILCN